MLARILEGRTDLVFDWVAQGGSPSEAVDGATLVVWCAYFGDVSGMRFLVASGASLDELGANHDLNSAAFHGHWRLCDYLIGQGADANVPLADTGETSLHAALCRRESPAHEKVVGILLAAGADPTIHCKADVETGCFMRDCRTQGEAPLHRAAAYGTLGAIERLISAGAQLDDRDARGDTPLTWASRALRPPEVLRLLCFPPHTISPDYLSVETRLA